MDQVDETIKVKKEEDLRSSIDWNFHQSESKETVPADDQIKKRTAEHPCFTSGPCLYARIHLPVAPKCNIQCNYCVRKFDCFNESRPGVTSKILSADAAFERYAKVKKHLKNLKVVGIAGPGDALANFEETKRTLELIRADDPEVTFCLSTNGLMLPFYAKELIDLGVTHFTVTLNAVNIDIGAKIYKFIHYFGKRYTGREAATILLANQLAGLRILQKYPVVTKVNCVALKGINEHHIPLVVKTMKSLGVYMTNIMPHIPITGSIFQDLPRWKGAEINELRNVCEVDMRQMRNCQQCRADAVGTLDHDLSLSDLFNECSVGDGEREGCKVLLQHSAEAGKNELTAESEKDQHLPVKRYAVATSNGKIIDMHFGEVKAFHIYDSDGREAHFVEKRVVGQYCDGDDCGANRDKWANILPAIADCQGVLAMKIGNAPKKFLRGRGIEPIVTVDTIVNAVVRAASSNYKNEEQLIDEKEISDLL
ncbi:MAG: nitrogenase cofactor biosynthesis protein NifB [Sporolactobacillus sp.]